MCIRDSLKTITKLFSLYKIKKVKETGPGVFFTLLYLGISNKAIFLRLYSFWAQIALYPENLHGMFYSSILIMHIMDCENNNKKRKNIGRYKYYLKLYCQFPDRYQHIGLSYRRIYFVMFFLCMTWFLCFFLSIHSWRCRISDNTSTMQLLNHNLKKWN